MMRLFLLPAIRSKASRLLKPHAIGRSSQPKVTYHSGIDADIARTETSEFRRKVDAELEQARQFIQVEAAKHKKGFVVLDIDETALDNRDFYRDPKKIFYKADDYTGDEVSFYRKWDLWVAQAKAPVLPLGKRLINWLNQHNISYRFVTGRIEEQREATMKNLQAASLIGDSFKGLYCKPQGGRNNATAAFKKQIVPEIEKMHDEKAIASIGDRDADMMLPEAQRNFKLSTSEFYPPRGKCKPLPEQA